MRSIFFWQHHLNKLRWFVLSLVMALLILLPYISVYQNYAAAHAYDLLAEEEVKIYDAMEWLTTPFVGSDVVNDLNAVKGTTWSGTFFGLKLSDPLAVLGQMAAQLKVYEPFLITALIPVLATVLFGRFYCGWICPATFLYEITDKIALFLRRIGFPAGRRRLDPRWKYGVLALGVGLSFFLGTVLFSTIYPPAILGRALYYGIAMNSMGVGVVFFAVTLLFDLFVARRGFCRYLCPGGALYALLGARRPVRIQRRVEQCNDCTLCDQECQFGLHPMSDAFGLECNNCTACIAVCPTDALSFALRLTDQPPQGHGHLGSVYLREHSEHSEQENP